MKLNNVNLLGRITKDLELKYSQDGKEILSFPIVWNDRKKKSHFFNCVSFGKTAEIINQYFNKGDLIGVTGVLNQNVWEDKDGKKHYDTNIIVNEFSFCGGNKKEEQSSQEESGHQAPSGFDESQIPF